MPGNVRPIADERHGLLAFLAQQRDALRIAVHGLTEEQAWSRPSASAMTLGGLIKHAARCERGWIVGTVMQRDLGDDANRSWETEFTYEEGDTLAGWLDRYAEVARETEAIIAEIPDLGQPVPIPDAPWFPKDVKSWSVRWVLFHLIEEVARHAGHADIIRESLDGETFYALMGKAEGWPPGQYSA